MQGNKLYVGNLSYSVTNEQLEKLFSSYGKVLSANVIGNKGFGFVEMTDSAEAEKAKEVERVVSAFLYSSQRHNVYILLIENRSYGC